MSSVFDPGDEGRGNGGGAVDDGGAKAFEAAAAAAGEEADTAQADHRRPGEAQEGQGRDARCRRRRVSRVLTKWIYK